MMNRFTQTVLLCLTACLCVSILPVQAQADKWPSKPVKYIVPFPPGGTTDILARIIAQKLSASLGQQVLVDNKPGAGGNIGSDFVAKSAADGYTILGGTISSHAINVSMYKKMPYDAVKDFAPITLIGTNANILVVHPNNPAKNLAEFIANARARKEPLNFASAGTGTSQHLCGEMFKSLTGLDMLHIPYKGSAPAIQDVMGEQVSMMFDTTVVAGPFVKSGKLRALGVTSAKRVKGYEDIPTIAEAGVPGYAVVSWQGIFAPAGTPADIVQRLNVEIVKILRSPDIIKRLEDLGLEPAGNTPAEFAAFQKAEIAKWAQIIKAANISAD
jgi:tripartite-type tricarboxylate transporter receptor subunit TctC